MEIQRLETGEGGFVDIHSSLSPLFKGGKVGIESKDGEREDCILLSGRILFRGDGFCIYSCGGLLVKRMGTSHPEEDTIVLFRA